MPSPHQPFRLLGKVETKRKLSNFESEMRTSTLEWPLIADVLYGWPHTAWFIKLLHMGIQSSQKWLCREYRKCLPKYSRACRKINVYNDRLCALVLDMTHMILFWQGSFLTAPSCTTVKFRSGNKWDLKMVILYVVMYSIILCWKTSVLLF